MTDLFDTYKVIDVDTHLTEPPDTWTRSFPASLHDKVPHIERVDGVDQWMVSGERIGAPGYYSMAGFDGIMPISTPPVLLGWRKISPGPSVLISTPSSSHRARARGTLATRNEIE